MSEYERYKQVFEQIGAREHKHIHQERYPVWTCGGFDICLELDSDDNILQWRQGFNGSKEEFYNKHKAIFRDFKLDSLSL